MALIVNLMRDPKKNKPVKAEDFNPYTVKEKAFLKAPPFRSAGRLCQKVKLFLSFLGFIKALFCKNVFIQGRNLFQYFRHVLLGNDPYSLIVNTKIMV